MAREIEGSMESSKEKRDGCRLSIYIQRPEKGHSDEEFKKYPGGLPSVYFTGHAYVGLYDGKKEVFYEISASDNTAAMFSPIVDADVERTTKKRSYSDRIDYPISADQFLAARDYAEKLYDDGANYSLLCFNCADFACKVAKKAGLVPPNKGAFISRPVGLASRISKLEKEYSAIMAEFNKASHEIDSTFSKEKKTPAAEKIAEQKQADKQNEEEPEQGITNEMPDDYNGKIYRSTNLIEVDEKDQKDVANNKTPKSDKWDVSKRGVPVTLLSRLKKMERG